MVLVKRQIPSVQHLFGGDGDESTPLGHIDDVPQDKVLQVTNQTNLAGILTQFTLLSQYANEMFSNLLTEANVTCNRIKDLSSRTDKLQNSFDSIEGLFQGDMVSLLSKMNNSAREVYTSTDPEEHQHFTVESRSSSIQDVYNKAALPPALELLDPFAEDGKSCLTKYTHPQFFFEKWYEEQVKKLKEMKAERKRKRAERQAQKSSKSQGARAVKKMRKVRYDPQTGEKIIEEGEGDFVPISSKRHTLELNTPITDDVPSEHSTSQEATPNVEPDVKKKPKKEKKKKEKSSTPKEASPVPSRASKSTKESGKSKTSISEPAPPAPTETIPEPISAPPPPISNVAPPPPPPPPVSGPGDAKPKTATPPPPPVHNPTPTPPPPPVGGPAPPPPPPPTNTGGPGKPDLLESIRSGQTLKPVSAPTEPKEKPVDTRSNLLESIRLGIKLESAGNRQLAEKKPVETKPLSVAEILARRVAIEPDSDEELDDDDDDWSD